MNLEEIIKTADAQNIEYNNIKEKTAYSKTKAKIEKIEDKIYKLEQQRDKLKTKAEKQKEKHYKILDNIPSGTHYDIIELIAKEIIRRNPEINSYELLGPFGINGETSIWFFADKIRPEDHDRINKIMYSLTFHRHLLVWNGGIDYTYAKDSLGALNGDNKIMVHVESIEQLETLMKLKV